MTWIHQSVYEVSSNRSTLSVSTVPSPACVCSPLIFTYRDTWPFTWTACLVAVLNGGIIIRLKQVPQLGERNRSLTRVKPALMSSTLATERCIPLLTTTEMKTQYAAFYKMLEEPSNPQDCPSFFGRVRRLLSWPHMLGPVPWLRDFPIIPFHLHVMCSKLGVLFSPK